MQHFVINIVVLVLILQLDGSVSEQRLRCCYLSGSGTEWKQPEEQMIESFELDVDSDNSKIEEVDRLTARYCSPDRVYCMQYLIRRDIRGDHDLKVFRGFGKRGNRTCAGTSSSHQGDLLYCYECDSDLCNNSNMWRPRERIYNNYDENLKDLYENGGRAAAPWLSLVLLLCVVLTVV